MTHRERFRAALERKPPSGRVPHFELVFFLTMECFGKVHPNHRSYRQWGQMEESERELHRVDMAGLYVATAERFEHSAILIHNPAGGVREAVRLAELIRGREGQEHFLAVNADPTYSIPRGADMAEWCARLYEQTDEVKDQAARRLEGVVRDAEAYAASGVVDGFCMCCDYCFNTGPFLNPEMFAEVHFK